MAKTITTLAAVVVMVATFGPVAYAADAPPEPGAAFEHVHGLALDAAGRSLWLGAHTGLFRSEDGGQTWTKVPMPGQHQALDVMAVTADPRDAAVLYVATHEAGV